MTKSNLRVACGAAVTALALVLTACGGNDEAGEQFTGTVVDRAFVYQDGDELNSLSGLGAGDTISLVGWAEGTPRPQNPNRQTPRQGNGDDGDDGGSATNPRTPTTPNVRPSTTPNTTPSTRASAGTTGTPRSSTPSSPWRKGKKVKVKDVDLELNDWAVGLSSGYYLLVEDDAGYVWVVNVIPAVWQACDVNKPFPACTQDGEEER